MNLTPIIYFLTEKARAQDALDKFDPVAGSFHGTKKEFLFDMLSYFLNLMPYLLGGLAFFGLLYSSVIYFSAMGDPSRTEAAKKNITWIVTGIVMIAVVLVVINIIFNIVGKAVK